VSGTIVYKRRVILKISEQPEKWRVVFEGEEFDFPTLEKAMRWVDFVSKAGPTNHNSSLTC